MNNARSTCFATSVVQIGADFGVGGTPLNHCILQPSLENIILLLKYDKNEIARFQVM